MFIFTFNHFLFYQFVLIYKNVEQIQVEEGNLINSTDFLQIGKEGSKLFSFWTRG